MLKKLPAWLKLGLKIAVTALCLWYVSQKVNWLDAIELVRHSSLTWLLAAGLCFVASKVVSALRLNLYFSNIGISLTTMANLRLYWLGMFYNLFLPGGIGGDAYKVLLLHQQGYAQNYKYTSAAVLLDRISGVVGLGILAVLCYSIIFKGGQYSAWLCLAILPGLTVYRWGVGRFFHSFIPSFYPTLGLGVAVQLLQMVGVWCIMQSIGLHQHFFPFQLLFLLSSIVAILPFTVGGLGARELVFLWGATQFGLQQHQAVYISLLFYFITVLASFWGVLYVFRSPISPAHTAAQGYSSRINSNL